MANPFDHVKSVWNTKEYLVDNRELFNKSYTPFIVNRSLSNDMSGVLFANEMNKYSSLDKDIQYDFYFYGIPKQRSYLKWTKKTNSSEFDSDLVQELAEYMGVSLQRAEEYFSLINKSDIDTIKKLKGGRK